MFFVLKKDFDNAEEIVYNSKDKKNVIKYILNFMKENNIKNILDNGELRLPHIEVGRYVVKKNENKYEVWTVTNTGYVMDYFEYVKEKDFRVIDYTVKPDNIDDTDDVTVLMSELVARSNPIDIKK